MNEELQIVLTEILNTTLDAKDFIAAELPEVIQQLLMWKMVESLAFLLLIPTYIFIMYKLIKPYRVPLETKEDCENSPYFEWHAYSEKPVIRESVYAISHITLLSLTSIGGLLTILVKVNITWLQIWIAPKVYLIEYLRGMAL